MTSISPESILSLIRDFQIIDADESLTPETDLFSSGLDSMAVMQLLLAIEETHQISLAPTDLTRENLVTAKSIAALLNSK